MKDEKQYTEGIAVKENKFLLWFDNYWYHYKWHTVVAAFLIVVCLVCTIQACSSKPSDITITYAGRVSLAGIDKESVAGAFSENLSASLSKEASVTVIPYYVLSKEQIEAAEKETHEDGEKKYVDRAYITSQKEEFESQLQTDTSSILLLDPWLYQEIKGTTDSTEVLKPLSAVLGQTPEGAIDAYGIRLGDTEIYRTTPELRCLPEDTIVCLFEKRLWQKEKDYNKEIEAFKSFIKLATVDEESN